MGTHRPWLPVHVVTPPPHGLLAATGFAATAGFAVCMRTLTCFSCRAQRPVSIGRLENPLRVCTISYRLAIGGAKGKLQLVMYSGVVKETETRQARNLEDCESLRQLSGPRGHQMRASHTHSCHRVRAGHVKDGTQGEGTPAPMLHMPAVPEGQRRCCDRADMENTPHERRHARSCHHGGRWCKRRTILHGASSGCAGGCGGSLERLLRQPAHAAVVGGPVRDVLVCRLGVGGAAAVRVGQQ